MLEAFPILLALVAAAAEAGALIVRTIMVVGPVIVKVMDKLSVGGQSW